MTVGETTNAIYQELLDSAIEVECDVLAGGDDAADATMLKMFGSAAAITTELLRLQELNRSVKHYRIGPYHSFLVHELVLPYIQAVNDPAADAEMRTFCGGRYVVAGIDQEDVELDLFGDNDVEWAANLVNGLGRRAKSVLGLEDGVFGVVNELAPAPEELAVVEQDPSDHVLPIGELTPEAERGLRIRYVGEQEAVQMELRRLGAMYQRGKVFPYPLDWI